MDNWCWKDDRSTAIDIIRDILTKTETALPAFHGHRPRVMHIRVGEDEHSAHAFEVDVEIVPGLDIVVRYENVDAENYDADQLEGYATAVPFEVVQAVKDAHKFGITALTDRLHQLRIKIRQAMASWADDGVCGQLIDVRFLRDEYWLMSDLTVEIRLTDLDNFFRPTTSTIRLESSDDLIAVLSHWHSDLRAKLAMLIALGSEGADRSVDRLALNAIDLYWERSAAFRGDSHGKVTESAQLFVNASAGHIRCDGSDENSNLLWRYNTVTLLGRSLSSEEAAALLGRPVTELIDHPILTKYLIITAIENNYSHLEPRLIVSIDQPKLLACSVTGRVWEAQHP